MNESEYRYPETPLISYKHSRTDIEYNGVKLYIRNVAYKRKGRIRKAHSVEFARLDHNIFTGDCRSIGVALTERQAEKFKKLNLQRKPHREYLLEVIQEYAPWFTHKAEITLEDLIVQAVDPNMSPRPVSNNYKSTTLPSQRDEKERKQFCDVWKLVLRLNISPEEAEEQLRTGNYKDQL